MQHAARSLLHPQVDRIDVKSAANKAGCRHPIELPTARIDEGPT